MAQIGKSRRIGIRPYTQPEVNDLCATALHAWRQAPASAKRARFLWRGLWFHATHTTRRLIVRTPGGEPVAYMHDW
jgi:hypothetical protein